MSGGGHGNRRLKHGLARLFRSSFLRRSACTPTTAAAAAASVTEPSLCCDMAEPWASVPNASRRHLLHDRLNRSLSLHSHESSRRLTPSRRLSLDLSGCIDAGGVKDKRSTTGRRCKCRSSASTCVTKNDHKGDDMAEKVKKSKKGKRVYNSYRFSCSSFGSGDDDDDDYFGFFSSSDERVEDKLFSGKSFSSDSSDFYSTPKKKKRSPRKAAKKKTDKEKPARPHRTLRRRRNGSDAYQRSQRFSKDEEEEETKGVPMVKNTKDPYGDFRSSMVEMIVERQLFGAGELEKLLQYYLALNSSHHHPAIIRAFSDIWGVLYAF